MTIRVKLFAILRDTAGLADLPLTLPDGAPVSHALETLSTQHPALRPHLPRAAAAVNLSRATPDTILHDNDELALLPPVSGG
jgi:molybdopterin converting factor small subunit